MQALLSYLPFVNLIVSRGMPDAPPPMVTSIIEKAIVAIIAGGMGAYVSIKVLESQFIGLKEQVTAVSNQVERVNSKVEKLRDDLYIPRIR